MLIPNQIGFSLGTYAILFSLMTGRLKHPLRFVQDDQDVTFLDEINVTFFHVILVKVSALILASLSRPDALRSRPSYPATFPRIASISAILKTLSGGIGFFLLIYSITLIVGAALVVYRLALIVDPHAEYALGCNNSSTRSARVQGYLFQLGVYMRVSFVCSFSILLIHSGL